MTKRWTKIEIFKFGFCYEVSRFQACLRVITLLFTKFQKSVPLSSLSSSITHTHTNTHAVTRGQFSENVQDIEA